LQQIGIYSYLFASVGYLGLLLLLLTTKVSTLNAKILFTAVFSTALWCFCIGITGLYQLPLIYSFAPEILKNLSWGMLCINLLLKQDRLIPVILHRNQFSWFYLTTLAAAIFLTLALNNIVNDIYWLFMGLLTIPISHLVMIEFLYRQGSSEFKWGFKPLAMAVSAYAIVDLTLYSSSILTTQLNHDLFWLRGIIYVLLAPLLVMGVKRQKSLGVRLFISREVVFHSTLLLAISLYLIAMAVVGYYLKLIGGEWGVYSQITFILLALVILFFLFLSESLRNRVKVFISKHFFANRYDYRQQWLKLNANLSSPQHNDYQETALFALMDLFSIDDGALLILNQQRRLELCASLGQHSQLERWSTFLNQYQDQEKQWIIDLDEYERFPEIYPNMCGDITPMLDNHLRLIVPMIHQENLFGYFVLSRPGHQQIVNYEDRDLLFTAAQQLANFLALNSANKAILEASQFTAFNRMSAFLVHDLKNVVAQLSLVTDNAKHHRDNPEFIADTFDTIENSVTKMNKMLAQLRNKHTEKDQQRSFSLLEILLEVKKNSVDAMPSPTINCDEGVILFLNPEKLTNIIMHLVQNAQQACASTDRIDVYYQTERHRHVIVIEDSGCGMSEHFIKTRLFKPFDTTKGNAGMGIGAYEAKQFMQSLGGEIVVDSTEQQGTRISLIFP